MSPSRTGLARALSKLGHCSRSTGFQLIRDGLVRLNGRICRNPEQPVHLTSDKIEVEGTAVTASTRIYLMLNKPRGLVTTVRDEQGRDTVFQCLSGAPAAHLSPVGRLDKASEGLLLFTNDNAWADSITNPKTHLNKTYHVQIGAVASDDLLEKLHQGAVHDGESLAVKDVSILRVGEKNSWLEITLDEGRNRHIRRLREVFDIEVLRLIRIAIGSLQLGDLAKGAWRTLTEAEIARMAPPSR